MHYFLEPVLHTSLDGITQFKDLLKVFYSHKLVMLNIILPISFRLMPRETVNLEPQLKASTFLLQFLIKPLRMVLLNLLIQTKEQLSMLRDITIRKIISGEKILLKS